MDFIDRYIIISMRVNDFNKGALSLAPHGSYWRLMRRLLTSDMLSIRRLNESAHIRRKCVDNLLAWVEEEVREKPGQPIRVGWFVFLMSFNLLGNMMLSRDLVDPKSKEGSDFFETMAAAFEVSGQPNMADFLPWLSWIGPNTYEKKIKNLMGRLMQIVYKYIRERIEERKITVREERRKDYLDLLLDFKENGEEEFEKLTDHQITILTLELFLAGGDTTTSTVEWAMTELLRHPDALKMVKTELAQVVGRTRKVEDTDIENLPYLNAVVKETFRVHPQVPLLVPRKAVNNTVFMGYDIPKNTQVFVNAWAIGRDPEVWEDPDSFKPERFLQSGVKADYKGQNFEFIPFGAGRRICAGMPLAHRVVHLVLGSLIHHFDWELEPGVTKETLDMRDKLGITVRKFEPLLVVPKRATV